MNKSQITIIAAAGKGTRCFPISIVIPKEMFPVKNKPIIHYLIEEAQKFEAQEIIVVISEKKKIIQEYIANHLQNYNITIAIQKEPKGLLNLINGLKINDSKIINLILGDELIFFSDKSIKKINSLKQNNLIITQTNIPPQHKSKYGMFQVKDHKIIGFEEKPQTNVKNYTHAAIGRYFFQSQYLNDNKYKNENNLHVFIKDLVKSNNLEIIENKDLRYDISIPEELSKANK